MARKTAKLTKLQQRYASSVLCPAHAEWFGMPEGTCRVCAETFELEPDAIIECEVCATAKMRSLGVI